MTETGSTVERIHAELNYDGSDHWELVTVEVADVRALLAVVEAAQDVADAGVETKGGWFVDLDALLRLNHRLEVLHSQASDEGKP